MTLRLGTAVLCAVAALVAVAFGWSSTAGATCDSSAFHLTVTGANAVPATEPDGSALPAHRLPDGGAGDGYYAQITITGGAPPYTTGYGGYSLPPGINKSISSSPGTSNNDIVTISGTETGGSYAASLILTVLDKNGCGPTPADSRFDWLYGETPTNTGPSPSIPDPIAVGDQPSCSPGGWTGDANYPAITFSYEWRRTNADGTTTTVGSAQSYTPTTDDGGLHLECVVNATNRFGSTQAISNDVRVRYPPKNVIPPELIYSGQLVSGQEVLCYKASWVGAATITYTYRWIVTQAGGDHVVSTDRYYTPTGSDEHGDIRCEITASNQDGTATVASNTLRVLRPGHLTVSKLVVKGWRRTGNIEWIADGGPESAATPQLVFASAAGDSAGEQGVVEITLTNTGDVPSIADGQAVEIGPATGDFLPVSSVPPGGSYTTTFQFVSGAPGDKHFQIDVRPARDDPYRRSLAPFTVEYTPISRITEVTPTVVGGSVVLPPDLPPADRVEVDISIVRSREAQVMRARPIRCHWLAGTSGRLESVAATHGFCATPVWIRATVHGRTWSVRLRHPLPRGSYVVYARAFGRSKAFDATFDRATRNRRAFTVR